MAAATVLRRRINYEGSRKRIYVTLTLPAASPTYNTQLRLIDFWSATGPDLNAIGGTLSGGVITFQVSGGGQETPVLVTAEGY